MTDRDRILASFRRLAVEWERDGKARGRWVVANEFADKLRLRIHYLSAPSARRKNTSTKRRVVDR